MVTITCIKGTWTPTVPLTVPVSAVIEGTQTKPCDPRPTLTLERKKGGGTKDDWRVVEAKEIERYTYDVDSGQFEIDCNLPLISQTQCTWRVTLTCDSCDTDVSKAFKLTGRSDDECSQGDDDFLAAGLGLKAGEQK